MIAEYWGEYLISPVALEMSLNVCSHRCAYCFANLNQPERQANVPQIMRLLNGLDERKTLTAYLLRSRYPIVVSNRDDPFATSNYQQAIPILETLTALDIPVALQTKGGRGVADALRFLPPSVWYISISMLDDERRKRIEPGAPSIESRFDLIRQVTEAGHRAVVGLNPLVPEWLPGDDLPRLLEQVQAAGGEGAWIEILHLNYRQEARLSERERAALTQPIIDRARRKGADEAQWQALSLAYETCGELGLPFFSMGQPIASTFWQPFRACYPHSFPVMQDWVNWCYEHLEDGALVDFAAFAEVMGSGFPAGTWPIDGYLGNKAHNLWWTKAVPPQMTYLDLLKIIWSEPDLGLNPARMMCFALAADTDADGNLQVYADKAGLPLMVFSSQMFDDVYTVLGAAEVQ